jgi:hypothetical protein
MHDDHLVYVLLDRLIIAWQNLSYQLWLFKKRRVNILESVQGFLGRSGYGCTTEENVTHKKFSIDIINLESLQLISK